jgi:hypothetical protein
MALNIQKLESGSRNSCDSYAQLRDYEESQVKAFDRINIVLVIAIAASVIGLLVAAFIAEDTATSIATLISSVVSGSAAGVVWKTRQRHKRELKEWSEAYSAAGCDLQNP